MKTKIPLLSICIATYNRSKYIGETLESIIAQLTDEIEIVIVDGASTDNTCAIVQGYADTCKQVRYIQLPAKGGIDQDYCKAVEYAQGEMCWLFADDDLLKPNAISTVLREVAKGYSLIVVNAQLMNMDFSRKIANKLLQIDGNEVYSETELGQLFQRIVAYMSFIGCVVISRNLWLQREKIRYFGTEFIHVGVIFQLPLPAPALVIAEPYIAIRYGNAQWANRAFEVGMFKWPNLLSSFEHIPETIRMRYVPSTFWRKLQRMVVFRAKGEYSIKEYQKWLAGKSATLSLKVTSFLIAIMPKSLLNLFLLLYLRIARKDKIIAIYDLENNKNNILLLPKKKDV